MTTFIWYGKENIESFIHKRAGETKLGEHFSVGLDQQAKFAIIGLPESIGVKLNGGIGGTESLWEDFLESFCNLQDTDLLRGKHICIAGHLSTDTHTSVEEIDKLVVEATQMTVAAGLVPIVVGGGHNNAYGIIKGMSMAKGRAINAINIDAHADLRRMEGRHSGNGFTYALHEGYLQKYAMIGLHRNYNSSFILDQILHNPQIHATFYEEIFIEEKCSFDDAISQSIDFTSSGMTGLEIDLDSIEGSLSSASTPCGFQSKEVRKIIYKMSQTTQACYLHLAEGATILDNGRTDVLTGKLAAYLVSDFIRYNS